MTPYYQDDLVTIYHGDCREVIEALLPEVDAVLTDPPYGVGKAAWDGRIPDVTWIDVVLELAPVVAFTSGIKEMYAYPAPSWVMAWARSGSTQTNGLGGINNWEPILVYGRHTLPNDLIQMAHTPQPDAAGHPTPKPLRLYSKLVAAFSKPGDTILDPFMGSGTTLVAAKSLGRKAIGIEIEERYCEIAAQRCSQEVLGLSA